MVVVLLLGPGLATADLPLRRRLRLPRRGYNRAVRRRHRIPIFLFLVFLLPSLASGGHARHPDLISTTCQTSVYYSPHGGATEAIIHSLNKAERTIRVAAYGLTHPDLVRALIAARARGIDVAVKTDKVQSAGQAQRGAINRLEQAGITVEVSTQSRLLHHKFAVIDGRWVITGSFNWTSSAENSNRENLVVLDCPNLARSFTAEWELIRPNEP